MKSTKMILGAAIVCMMSATAASAQTSTANMAVSADVSTVCSFNTTPLAFGEMALTGATPGTATLSITCTGGGAYTVGLGNGLHNVAAQRNLVSGVKILAYDLFQDPARGTRWGDAGAGLVSGTGTAAVQTLTVYGSITTGQALVGDGGTPYTDTILVTLTY
jgi:spore coat protein U-like protein